MSEVPEVSVEDAAAQFEQWLAVQDPDVVQLSRALRRLDAIADRRGWDQPPTLWGVRATRDEAGVRKLVWTALVTGDLLAGDQVAGVEGFAAFCESSRPVMPDLVGYALVSEGWMLRPSAGADFMAVGVARRVHAHPARIEARVISCVDVAGFGYSHTLSRDPALFGRLEAARPLRGPGGGPQAVSPVLDALARAVSATVGDAGALS